MEEIFNKKNIKTWSIIGSRATFGLFSLDIFVVIGLISERLLFSFLLKNHVLSQVPHFNNLPSSGISFESTSKGAEISGKLSTLPRRK